MLASQDDDEDASGGGQEGHVLLRTPLSVEASPRPRAPSVDMDLGEPYFYDCMGRDHPNPKKCGEVDDEICLGRPMQ